jgi:hypothetical protein
MRPLRVLLLDSTNMDHLVVPPGADHLLAHHLNRTMRLLKVPHKGMEIKDITVHKLLLDKRLLHLHNMRVAIIHKNNSNVLLIYHPNNLRVLEAIRGSLTSTLNVRGVKRHCWSESTTLAPKTNYVGVLMMSKT